METTPDAIIVSRHPAAIEFIARHLGGEVRHAWGSGAVNQRGEVAAGTIAVEIWPNGRPPFDAWLPPSVADAAYQRVLHGHQEGAESDVFIPVLAVATAEDVRGKIVYGNLPLHLAAEAKEVVAIEFTGDPPRGAEYTLADMDRAGAVLRAYTVRRAD